MELNNDFFGRSLLSRVPWQVAHLNDALIHSRSAQFSEWLLQSDFLTELEPEPADLGFQHRPYWVWVEEVEWAGTVYLRSRQVPDAVALDEYDIRLDVEFEAEISEGTALQDEWEVVAAHIPGRVRIRRRLPMAMRVGVLYDDEEWGVEKLAWRRVDVVGPGYSPEPAVGEGQLRFFDGQDRRSESPAHPGPDDGAVPS